MSESFETINGDQHKVHGAEQLQARLDKVKVIFQLLKFWVESALKTSS